jgi:hypothetical protein
LQKEQFFHLIGGFGLIHGALAFVQGVGRLVEPGLRGVAVLCQLADAAPKAFSKIDNERCKRGSASVYRPCLP